MLNFKEIFSVTLILFSVFASSFLFLISFSSL